ncbi:MAG: hypothetical protein HY910_05670 [Desulfarculus sp.]|nr:hypothetical protein [Desulfarculus sp.]
MRRHLELWLGAYLRQALRPRPLPTGRPLTICLAVADHFEPFWDRANLDTACSRLAAWEEGLPRLCQGIADSRGRPPQHTFFYPLEEYHPQVLERLAGLCRQGLGEVELHLHHHGETSEELGEKLVAFARLLHERHGLLRRDPQSGQVTYGFIHGNWALDNSLPDGTWCGVNDELLVLKNSGCYADFTLPSAPSPAQTRTINSVYYATDDPLRPKSHDQGRPAAVGRPPGGDLLLIQGVLALDWHRRKWGLMPRIENSDLNPSLPPDLKRLPLWLRHAPAVAGAEHVRFIKLACHGAPEKAHQALLGAPARRFLEGLVERYDDGGRYRLRFMTCWEMAQAVHALERGEEIP